MTTPKTARFWVWVNDGLVRIELRPGQSLAHYAAHQTDEGWSGWGCTWELALDGTVVHRQWYSEGRDCDGFLSHNGHDQCRVEDLASQPDYYDASVLLPKWTEAKPTSVYDESAQNAGY